MSALEHILENSELYQLIQGYPGGIIIFDLKGDILEVNEVVTDLLGCRETDLCGKKYFDISDKIYAAKEAETLKQQAFVDGHTKLYEKKYEFGGKSVLVTQHTYLLKDASKRPLCMVAMICPYPKEQEGAALADTVLQLTKENADLKETLARALPKDLKEAVSEIERLKMALGGAENKTAELMRALMVKDKVIELKDAQIRKLEEAGQSLRRELQETKGALEVSAILETEDDDKAEATHAPKETDSSADAEATPAAEPADPFADSPWDADDVIHDDDVLQQMEATPENEISENEAGDAGAATSAGRESAPFPEVENENAEDEVP